MALFGKKPDPGLRPSSGAPARAAEAPAVPKPAELSVLDFTVGGGMGRGGDDGGVQVQEISSGMSAAAEEAAVLYANGSFQAAEQVLAAVLDTAEASHVGEGLWMMLLDLYRLTGQRSRFEARVIDYATRFEKSPPPWEDLSNQAARRAPGSPPVVNLAGTLSAQAAQQFGQIQVIGRKSGAIRVDLGKLRGVDEAGAALLRQTLAQLKADRVKVSLANCGGLADMLSSRVQVGRADWRDGWLLLLELLINLGEQGRFEDLAVDYAVTFEESPPSWEERPRDAAPSMEQAHSEGGSAGCCLEGELTSAMPDVLRRLAAQIGAGEGPVVDCGRLRRIDFVSAGTLFNIIATLQAQGKLVVLRNVNAMVAALLRVMGVDQVAQITLRP